MTPETVGPLSRPVSVVQLPPEGLEYSVEATGEERAAIAKDFKLPAIHSLTGRYKLTGTPKHVRVVGQVEASITQICVVTLDPFDSTITETVDLEFAEPRPTTDQPQDEQGEYDPPDEILNGQVDLGALTAEFLALGLDPYPRKPGADFQHDAGDQGADSPFAALGKLKGSE